MRVLLADVVVGMSGGVDSTLAVLLLRERGYEVCGATLRLQEDSQHAIDEAKALAIDLGIEHFTIEGREAFGTAVCGPFAAEYAACRTPNPCVVCNRDVKFPLLFEFARARGIAHVATGHYARTERDPLTGRLRLLRGCDVSKDQSYMLYGLSQDMLSRVLFPLGHTTKDEMVERARVEGLACADAPESQDICFIPDGDYARYLIAQHGFTEKPGDIVDVSGNKLGRHEGLFHYTIGQRKGIGVAGPAPYYVLAFDVASNALIVGTEEELERDACSVASLNWVSIDKPHDALRIQAKTRYRQEPQDATLEVEGDVAHVFFDTPQRGIAAGQACVFYDGDVVLGGGTIVFDGEEICTTS